ncbi:MAG TPA: Fur family transcriptional regulator [Thermomicrobiales bacterium]|jgi:Fur family ferric uptake transcriptional regulator|nr:Fur family transcriptional regulator [Thermomicrobiales bacterium]
MTRIEAPGSATVPAITTNEIVTVLGQHGYRTTTPRQAVVDAVLRYQRPFTAEQIVADLKASHPSLGRATVYRTLEILASVDVLTRVLGPDGHSAYVVGVPGHRHHLICSRCGVAVAFTQCPMDDLVRSLTRDTDYEIEGHLIEVFGVCPQCRAAA